MFLTLTSWQIGKPRGRAFPVGLRHDILKSKLYPGIEIALLVDGKPVSRRAQSIEQVQREGNGLIYLEQHRDWVPFTGDVDSLRSGIHHDVATLWLSLPEDADPSHPDSVIVLRIGPQDASASATQAGPLLIVGVQRSGTTALQVGLHKSTRYRTQQDVNAWDLNTVEGFLFAKTFAHYALHRFVSPLGNQATQFEFITGAFEHSGQADFILSTLAQSVDELNTALSSGCRTWTDKSPGWEAVLMAPLFCALYPMGKVVFLSRDPVSCCLSMANKTGKLAADLENTEAAPRSLARFACNWSLTHCLWRRYCRPLLSSAQMMEIQFDSLREHPDEVVPDLGQLLGLTTDEAQALKLAMPSVPVRRTPIGEGSCDPRIPEVFARLCEPEANRWNYESATLDGAIEVDRFVAFRSAFREHLATRTRALGFQSDGADHLASRLIDERMHDDDIPTPRIGQLLSARLRASARRGQRSFV